MFAWLRNPVSCPVGNGLIATDGLVNYGDTNSCVVGSCHGEENETVMVT